MLASGVRGDPGMSGMSESGLNGVASSIDMVWNSVVEKFGIPQLKQYHEMLCMPLYTAVDIPIHSLCIHLSQESQHIPGVVHLTALLQIWQGYLVGPGFSSTSFALARSIMARYRRVEFLPCVAVILDSLAGCRERESDTAFLVLFAVLRAAVISSAWRSGVMWVRRAMIRMSEWVK